jgi:hypothetical protein
MARPMPLEAPVTTATCPSTLNLSWLSAVIPAATGGSLKSALIGAMEGAATQWIDENGRLILVSKRITATSVSKAKIFRR